MTKVTEELIAQFIQMHRRGDSFRVIGAKFGVDPRTVKSGIEKGGKTERPGSLGSCLAACGRTVPGRAFGDAGAGFD